jgi:L-threonylcarbamoyladenylate synthase
MFASLEDTALISCLNEGGVVVIPTDTMYGIVARANDQQAVERVYRVRGRAPEKPCIILVAGAWQIADTALWTSKHKELAAAYWPGPLSLVAPTAKTPEYLHRGTHTMAYRVPAHRELSQLLSSTGPIIAPSANPEGRSPAKTLLEAQAYFGDKVDGYVDGGTLPGDAPSTVAGVKNGEVYLFRQGALKLER